MINHYDHLIEKAARQTGVEIDPANMLVVGRTGRVIALSVAREFARVAPRDYAGGVDLGVAWIEADGIRPRVAPGGYRLVSEIGTVALGRQRGYVAMIDDHGRRTARVPALYDVHALDLPSEALGRVRLLPARQFLLAPDDVNDDDEICIGIEIECDNGSEICIGFVYDPTPIDPPE
jgi:hypothetical protein